jgi:hypothetical protein
MSVRPFVIPLLLAVCAAAGADPPERTGLTAGLELGIGQDAFSWVEKRESSDYVVDGSAVTLLGSVSAGVWVSRSLRLQAQLPGLWLVPGHRDKRSETVTALFPGVQASYHFLDSHYYLFFSAGWMVTLNTGGDAGAPSVGGLVYGGGAGYWLAPHVWVKAEADFSSVHTTLSGADTDVDHLIIWASLGVSL